MWIWDRLFDAMVYCQTQGYGWDTVYNWNVGEFSDVYHALQRNDARKVLGQFSCMQQAFGGDKKSVKAYIESVTAWLPAQERGSGAGVDAFISIMKKGIFKG